MIVHVYRVTREAVVEVADDLEDEEALAEAIRRAPDERWRPPPSPYVAVGPFRGPREAPERPT